MTKERLREYQKLKHEQQQIREQLDKVEAVLFYPKNQQLTGMPSAPVDGNPQEDLAIHHIELVEKYKTKMAELAEEQLAIEKAIDTLDPTARMLMRYRYIDGLQWEEVCIKICYSWRQTHRLHGEALLKLKEMEGETPQELKKPKEQDPCKDCEPCVSYPDGCDGCNECGEGCCHCCRYGDDY